jgi:hypothetical protein
MKNKREEKRAQNSELRIKRAQVTVGRCGREFPHRSLTDVQSADDQLSHTWC